MRAHRAVWLILSLLGCRGVEAPPAPPDLLVFLAPGLRADAAGQPGAEAALLAPFGDRPLRRFTAAHAQSVSGWVSQGSLLSGRYPAAIPLCGLVSAEPEAPQPWCSRPPEALPTLPRVLGLYGYRSAHIQTGPGPHTAMELGFDTRHVLETVEGRTDFEALGGLLTELMAAPEPLLAVVVMPDLEVQQRPRLREAMGLPGEPSRCEQGGRRAGRPRLDGRPGVPEAAAPLQPGSGEGARPELQPSCPPDRWDPAVDGLPGPSAPVYPWSELDRDRVAAIYRQEAAWLGRSLYGLVDRAPGEPLVVISALHGLDLGELSGSSPAPKALASHELLLDRTLRVPLVLLGPGVREELVAQPVELLDLMPTLASLAGAVSPSGLPGEDLLAPGFTLDPSATAYAAFGDMLYLRQGPWAASLRTLSHQATALDPALTEALSRPLADPAFHLHQVLDDPLQQRELKSEQPALAEQLRERMRARREGPAAPPEALRGTEGFLELRLQGSEGYW